MIADLFIGALDNVFTFLISFLPSASALPSAISSAFDIFADYFSMINSIFPLDTLFVCFGFVIVFEGGILLFKLTIWTYHQFWGSN